MQLVIIFIMAHINVPVSTIETLDNNSDSPFHDLPEEIVKVIANYSGTYELCALSRVSKWCRNMTRSEWENRRDQTLSCVKMQRIWERMRGYPWFPLIFGQFPIFNKTAKFVIEHLIHQMDGRCDITIWATSPVHYIGDITCFATDSRTLLQSLYSHQERYLPGGHPLMNPPHRFERYRCNISDSKMHLFDEYISLFIEGRRMRDRIIGMQFGTRLFPEALRWQKMMEIIGAKIGYPNMAFYSQRDISDDSLPFGVLFTSVVPEWSRFLEVDDYVQRLKVFQNKTEVICLRQML